MRVFSVISFVTALGVVGCTEVNDAANEIAQDQAKGVVNGIVADKFPGVNVAPVTDCIIDAATAGEILQIAGAAATGATQSTVDQVVAIAQRPDAVNCIAQNSISLLN